MNVISMSQLPNKWVFDYYFFYFLFIMINNTKTYNIPNNTLQFYFILFYYIYIMRFGSFDKGGEIIKKWGS